jgi:hypothetical protein
MTSGPPCVDRIDWREGTEGESGRSGPRANETSVERSGDGTCGCNRDEGTEGKLADPDQGRMKRASKGAVTRRVELNETKVQKANVAEPDEGEGKERREKKIR